MENQSFYEYSTPVSRALIEPNLVMGIGLGALMFILVVSVILMNTVSPWCASVGVVLYIIARMICKKDPHAMTILYERILQPNVWRCI
jgi:type IV secretion system protein VirB3